MATGGDVIVRFENVSFEYGYNKHILDEVSFPIRRGGKFSLMGQNGSGKSTIFGLIMGMLHPENGKVHTAKGVSVAISRQVIPRSDLELTVREFFEKCFKGKVYDIDPRIEAVLEVVNFYAPHDRIIKSFSGGQQARLLLASALIQDSDVLLLDEPTNNLDKEGIAHLTDFLKNYQKTCIVISHDAHFLNAFTEGVFYLNIHTRKVEQFVGNYTDVVKQITAQIEKENMKNAQLAKEIQANKDKANFFAMKGGQMRMVAKRMREKAEEMEEAKVDIRKEDKTIRGFTIPAQPELSGVLLHISSVKVIRNHTSVVRLVKISLKKKHHLLLTGPNGIGKSTLLETIAKAKSDGSKIAPGVRVGYYRQDFSTLDFDDTVYQSLASAAAMVDGKLDEERMRAVAASFLITSDVIHTKIGSLSEGQKGLVAFAQLVLERPGLLILDEPTNHINFRHLPVIAKALDQYEGAMILVSHVPEFVKQIRIDEVLYLGK